MARSCFNSIILCIFLFSFSFIFHVSLNHIVEHITRDVENALGSLFSITLSSGNELGNEMHAYQEKVPYISVTSPPPIPALLYPSVDVICRQSVNEKQENTPTTTNEFNFIPPTTIPPSPTILDIENTTYTPSPSTPTRWPRLPVIKKPRSPYNDIYRNTRNPHSIARHGEFEFIQDYRLKYYIGSSPDPSPHNESGIPLQLLQDEINQQFQTPPPSYDITMISQTSYQLPPVINPRTERLFYFSHLLDRWGG